MIILLQRVRLSFADLFEPKAFKPGDALRYKATFLIPKNDLQIAIVEKAIEAVASEKWGAKAKGILASIRGNANKFCFQDGDNKSYDGYGGMMALSSGSKAQPLIQDSKKTQLLTPVTTYGCPYSGCYVHGSVSLFAYTNSGNGIAATLRAVRFYKDGDAFAGGAPVTENEFDNVSDFGEEESTADLL